MLQSSTPLPLLLLWVGSGIGNRTKTFRILTEPDLFAPLQTPTHDVFHFLESHSLLLAQVSKPTKLTCFNVNTIYPNPNVITNFSKLPISKFVFKTLPPLSRHFDNYNRSKRKDHPHFLKTLTKTVNQNVKFNNSTETGIFIFPIPIPKIVADTFTDLTKPLNRPNAVRNSHACQAVWNKPFSFSL